MADQDATIKLQGYFDTGGIYEDAADASATLRGSLQEKEPPGELPTLTLSEDDDARADLKLGRTLGEGGVGVVSLARQNALRRDVAIKKTRSRDRAENELLHEAMMMGIVEHPNVVPVHLVGRDAQDGSPIIVMKHVEGVTWNEVLADPARAPEGKTADIDYHLRVLEQLCHAVRFAHSCGVLHLDIKPANVMLGEFGEVYLADWGIATPITAADSLVGAIRGTPSYMAPEMADPDDGSVDVRTDVFLLGATLHRVITGERLHKADTPMDTVVAAYGFERPDIPPRVDPELAQIVSRACARKPSDRYQSVEEFQFAIQRYLDHRESIELTRLAERGMEALEEQMEEGKPDPEELTEARFALRRALDVWPENPDARALRHALAEVVFEWAVAHDDLQEAERALAALEVEERGPFQQQLAQARERLERERRELAELRSRRDQLSGKRGRVIIGGGAALLWAGTSAYKGWKRWGVPLEEVDPNYLASLIPTFALPVFLLFWFRGIYHTSEFNRRLIIFFCTGIAAVASIRLTGWAWDLPAYVATGMEFIVYSVVGIVLGLLTDLRVSAACTLLIAATVLAVLFPGYQYVFMSVAFSIVAPYVTWVWVKAGEA